MIEKWIRGLARARWFVVLLWVALTVGSVFVLPNLTEIAKQTDAKFIPADFDSMQANDLLNKISVDDKSKSNAILVLHRDGGLQQADHQWMEDKVKELSRDKEEIGLLTVQSAYDNPNLKDTFQSKDKTTEIASIGLPKSEVAPATSDTVDAIRKKLNDAPSGTQVTLTGSAPINKDYTATSEEGLKKTEVLTVVLVLVILLGVFRSPIAPLIPLITIAMSFLFARGFVAWGTKFGLPVSSFTETFLVAVLFGAGTDYCILLIHRFREELSHGHDRVMAMTRTMQTVGKTVVFSASTVLIAFFLLGFAKFGLYQSAVGVAIGMFMTLLAGLTLAPALMLILGPKLFWPFTIKPGQGHGESKFWGWMAGLVSRKPLAVLLITVLVLSPLMLLFKGERSFDNIEEIDPSISSVQGFRTVQKAFNGGEIMPITVALSSSNSMRTTEGIAAIEKASAAVAQLENVSAVRSAARPLGKQLEELTIPKILDKTTDGIGQAKSGVSQVTDGLGTLQSKMQEGASGVGQLHTGLDTIASKQREVASGTAQMAQGTSQIAAGLSQGANQLQDNAKQVKELQNGLNQLASSIQGVQNGLTGQKASLAVGVKQEQEGLTQFGTGLNQLQSTTASMADDLNALLKAHPELAQDLSFQALMGKQQGVTQGLTKSSQNVQGLQGGLSQLDDGLQKASAGLGQIAAGQTQAATGVGKLVDGLGQFQDQLGQASSALTKLSNGASQATSGLNQLADGTGTISGHLGELQSGIGQMADGVGKSKDGLSQVTNGLGQVQDAQQGIVNNGEKQVAGWYLPESALKESDMQKAVDTYISPDGKITKFDVVLSINPYSQEAMDMVEKVKDTLNQNLNGSVIEHPVIKATGVPSQNHELDQLSHSDFMRTGLLIVIGIYIVLALLLGSVLAPLYIIGSLLFSYTVTMGIVEFIFVKILGDSGLSWTVSFFAFILLVALGVDYSIFLMARFKEEYRPGGVVVAMKKAMTTTGGVIVSAAIIMGGTFGALTFAGVNSLMQIGTVIIIGLVIYAVVVMGLIVPALAILFGEANWWPLGGAKVRKNTKIEPQVSSSTNL